MAAQGTRAFEDEFNGQNCEGLHPGEQEVSNYMRIVQPENEEGRSAQTQYRSGSQAAEGSASGYEANSVSSQSSIRVQMLEGGY
jgi:hypothetical protein